MRERTRVIIMGAAGRDFHNFNACFRNDDTCEVVAFTATQIPNIEGRVYPAELAGKLYPNGIPIHAEEELAGLVRKHNVHQVIFSYSDVRHEYVMHLASAVNALGADFRLLGGNATMLRSTKPVVAVTASRTGCGKSQTTRHICDVLQQLGKKVVAVRHPMPYGDLVRQRVQRFASYDDLNLHECTIEEREEYEPHIDRGITVYAGVDYEDILRLAENEADVVVWDGGNNDLPMYRPDVWIVVVDPHRPGHEMTYYPGEANLRGADVVVINKMDTADYEGIRTVYGNIQLVNPDAVVIEAASPLFVGNPDQIRGKKVLVVEDGPTLTHGEMAYGAGYVAAKRFGAAEIVDPRPYAVGSIVKTYEKYTGTGLVLPAMGYGQQQMNELQETINNTPCDIVVVGTPIDLTRILTVKHPMERVRYELQVLGRPSLLDILKERLT